jgi:hypothetical protein
VWKKTTSNRYQFSVMPNIGYVLQPKIDIKMRNLDYICQQYQHLFTRTCESDCSSKSSINGIELCSHAAYKIYSQLGPQCRIPYGLYSGTYLNGIDDIPFSPYYNDFSVPSVYSLEYLRNQNHLLFSIAPDEDEILKHNAQWHTIFEHVYRKMVEGTSIEIRINAIRELITKVYHFGKHDCPEAQQAVIREMLYL